MSKRHSRPSAPADGTRRRRVEIFERIRQSTVGFALAYPNQKNRKPKVIGSGVLVHAEGVVITARHVVLDLEAMIIKERRMGASVKASVFLVGSAQLEIMAKEGGKSEETATIEYTLAPPVHNIISRGRDLAVVGIRSDSPAPPPARVNFDLAPQGGDPVATCGWPYGLELHPGQLVSSFLVGTVSAVVPHPAMPARSRIHYLMQLPVNPGNSGGPVFDPDTGEVYGIVSSRYEPRGIPAGLSIVEPAFPTEPMVAEMVQHLRKLRSTIIQKPEPPAPEPAR